MNKLSIYVSTFDGYSDLWDNFFKVFNINFNSCPYRIYMSTNYKDYTYDSLTVIKTGEEISWMNRIKKSIGNVDSEYILFLLEDYLIGTNVDYRQLDDIVNFMIDNDIQYYRLQDIPKSESKYKNIDYLGRINSKQKYGVNTIVSIWNKNYLLKIIEEANDVKTAWDFEVYLCKRFNSINEEFIPNCCVDKRDLLKIKNGVYRGKWFRSTIKYFKNQGINLDVGTRKIMSWKDQLLFNMRSLIGSHVTIQQKEKLKNILRKFGMRFLSDGDIGGLQ